MSVLHECCRRTWWRIEWFRKKCPEFCHKRGNCKGWIVVHTMCLAFKVLLHHCLPCLWITLPHTSPKILIHHSISLKRKKGNKFVCQEKIIALRQRLLHNPTNRSSIVIGW
eukprot:UN12088